MTEIFKVVYRKSDMKWIFRTYCKDLKKWVTRWEVEDCAYVMILLGNPGYRKPKYVLTNIQAFDTLDIIKR